MEDCEEWRPVEKYEGVYEVSSFGRVRSLNREDSAGKKRRGRILSPGTQNGYKFVGLHSGDKYDVVRIHILVARAFVGKRPFGLVINHKDSDRANNHFSNLEYVTPAENVHHAARQARYGDLSIDEVQAIRSLVSRDPAFDLALLAEKLDIELQAVCQILDATRYMHVPNKDGTESFPIPYTHCKPMMVEDIQDLQALGFTIPEIGRYYKTDYSAPYQALRRVGIHQPNGHIGTGRRTAKSKDSQAIADTLPLFLE